MPKEAHEASQRFLTVPQSCVLVSGPDAVSEESPYQGAESKDSPDAATVQFQLQSQSLV